MNSTAVQPFFDAASAVFSQMFGIEAHLWEISGILGIAGSCQGVVALRFPLKLVDELLRASGVETSGELDRLATASGLVAEMTNIVSGNAIGSYAGMSLDISPPVVIKGKNHQISWPKIAPVIATAYETALGPFELAVCFNGH
jgi:CheY-specific phosphatase CheX